MGAYIYSIDVPAQAQTGQEICPGVLVVNDGSEAVAVGLSWSDESGPSAIEGITILGVDQHESETLHPPIRIMPASDVNWGVTIWRINEDGITWSKVATRTFFIENITADGGEEPEEPEEPGETEGMSTTTKLVIGGVAAAGLLLGIGGIVMAGKK